MFRIDAQRVQISAPRVPVQGNPAQSGKRERIAGVCLTALGLIGGVVALVDHPFTHAIYPLAGDQFVISAIAIVVGCIGTNLLVNARKKCNSATCASESRQPANINSASLLAHAIERSKKVKAPWSCVKRWKDPEDSRGYVYEFEYEQALLKDGAEGTIDSYIQIQLDMYPAVEPHPLQIYQQGFSKSGGQNGRLTDRDIPWEALGFYLKKYNETCYVLELPDINTLLDRWRRIKEKGLVKHDLKLVLSQGVASHREFINGYCEYDALVSSGTEFVHDMLVHVRPLICRIFSCESAGRDYIKVRNECANTMRKTLNKLDALENLAQNSSEGHTIAKEIDSLIKHRKLLEASYGLFVDNATANYTDTRFSSFIFRPVDKICLGVFANLSNTVITRIFYEEIMKLPEDSPVREDAAKGILSLWHTFEGIKVEQLS